MIARPSADSYVPPSSSEPAAARGWSIGCAVLDTAFIAALSGLGLSMPRVPPKRKGSGSGGGGRG